MNAVIIGAGRIGCGLAGQLLHSSGYEITFVTRDRNVVDNLHRNGGYQVVLTSMSECRYVTVSGVKAVPAEDTARAVEAISHADVIVTAVCAQNLPAVAWLIAQGLERRQEPTNVIAFENMEHVGPCLRRLVAGAMACGADADKHGFSGAVISRMVTQRLGDPADESPLTFVGEMVEDVIVDRRSLRSPMPQIQGVIPVDNYHPWVLRKLYTFSAGHATAAYLGWLKGYRYIHTAIRDPEIRKAVLSAMEEGLRGLAARFGSEFASDAKQLRAIVERFENAALNDPIQRVARDPRRKLAAGERLVGAAKLAEEAGINPKQLALATAAALCFCSVEQHGDNCIANPECAEVCSTLSEVCGLDSARGFGKAVANSWARLAPGLSPGNLLLSLNQHMWALQ
jgi:mannitol-1-phosphate 5-dehydrogenase